MFDRLFALETLGIKLGLENISLLCAALGHPERSFISLHVAGTNGKGSVTAMAHAGLVASGLRAARFISPHLVDLTERFVIGADPVDARLLDAVAHDVLDCADGLIQSGDLQVHPTFFEATTAIAFELFRRSGVEVAVIEVGLGGRFDSTNVVPATVGAITSIALDHQELLGDSLAAIAFEKAGIIKPKMTVVTGALPAEARTVIAGVAAGLEARVIDAVAGTRLESDVHDGRATLTVETPVDRYGPVTLGLRGDHQVGNALVAIRLLSARGLQVSRFQRPPSSLASGTWTGPGGSSCSTSAAAREYCSTPRTIPKARVRWRPISSDGTPSGRHSCWASCATRMLPVSSRPCSRSSRR